MPSFLIYTHQEPQILARVCSRLGPYPVFVHVDLKADLSEFVDAIDPVDLHRVHFIADRGYVNWAGWSQMVAIRKLVSAALLTTELDDYIVILSGQDYPIKPVQELVQALNCFPRVQYLRAFIVDESDQHFRDQVDRRHYRDLPVLVKRRLTTNERKFRNALIRGMSSLDFIRRRRTAPKAITVAHGGTHFLLTARCITELESMVTPEIEKYFKRTFCPEEHFYQSLLVSSTFAKDMFGGGPSEYLGPVQAYYANLHLIDETTQKIFTHDDFSEVQHSAKFFVRKVAAGRSAKFLDRVDAELLKVKPKLAD